MIFTPELIPATFIKRYKRFFADAILADGTEVVAHCPNTGSMKNLLVEGAPCYLTFNDDPKRKLKYTLELLDMKTSLVGVNTNRPNKIVQEAINNKQIKLLENYTEVIPEQKYGANSRIDLLLKGATKNEILPDCYVEVKSVTLAERNPKNQIALFPDAVTTRGTKHLNELAEMVKQGHRAVMFFLINRGDCTSFSPAENIDPTYAQTLRRVAKEGVELLAYDCTLTAQEICVRGEIKIKL